MFINKNIYLINYMCSQDMKKYMNRNENSLLNSTLMKYCEINLNYFIV